MYNEFGFGVNFTISFPCPVRASRPGILYSGLYTVGLYGRI
jgi:hypothetical protein